MLLETSLPGEPSKAPGFPFSGSAEGKAGAGPRPVPSCQPLAGSSLFELSSLPPPEPGRGNGWQGREPRPLLLRSVSGRRGGTEGMHTRGVTSEPPPRGAEEDIRRVLSQKSTRGAQRGNIHVGCHLRPTSERDRTERTCGALLHTLLVPPALPQEAQQAQPSALFVPPGPPVRGLRFPATSPGLAPPPPSHSLPHGITVSVVSPWHIDPFPTSGLGGERNYHSRPPLRRRACATGVEVREAAALRELRRPRGGESGGGFRVGRGAAGGARYRTGSTGTGGV